ncbi:MAG: hypothetical protein ABJN98_15900 [Roseibium sp.]
MARKSKDLPRVLPVWAIKEFLPKSFFAPGYQCTGYRLLFSRHYTAHLQGPETEWF